MPIDPLPDDVSGNHVSKTLFAVSEFANLIRAGAKALPGEALLCANLGFGCRLTSSASGARHAMLFDTGPEGPIFLRNCANLGVSLAEIECIAVSYGHWDHMGALPATLAAIREQGGRTRVHVNPGPEFLDCVRLDAIVALVDAEAFRPRLLCRQGGAEPAALRRFRAVE